MTEQTPLVDCRQRVRDRSPCVGHTPPLLGENPRVAAYALNDVAVRHAKRLIDARQYVLRSRWQNVQPRAKEQNAYLKTHSWDEYAAWHLGLTEGAPGEAKARYAFVYGDFRRLHRMGYCLPLPRSRVGAQGDRAGSPRAPAIPRSTDLLTRRRQRRPPIPLCVPRASGRSRGATTDVQSRRVTFPHTGPAEAPRLRT